MRTLDRDTAHVTQHDLGIDLEHRGEFERALGGRRVILGLDPRIAGDPQVLLTHGVVETFLDRIGNDVRTDLRAVLLRDHLHRHLAGPEARQLDRLGEARQPLADFALDLLQGHRNAQTALQLAQ